MWGENKSNNEQDKLNLYIFLRSKYLQINLERGNLPPWDQSNDDLYQRSKVHALLIDLYLVWL